MKVSVIIVNYKTPDLLKECLASVYEKTFDIDFEVIVVDNASEDNTQEIVTNSFPKVKYIQSSTNLGFGRANNLGYSHASGDYIFLLNPDTLLLNNALKILSDTLDRNPQIAIAGGQLFDSEIYPTHSYMMFIPGLLYELDTFISRRLSHHLEQRRKAKAAQIGYFQVGYITGADMMLRRSVIEKQGMFDPDFFLYFEETEMTHRHHKEGISACVQQAQIVHLEGKSMETSQRREQFFHNSRQLYYKKCYSLPIRLAANFIYWCYLKSRIILYSLRKNHQMLNRFRIISQAFCKTRHNKKTRNETTQ